MTIDNEDEDRDLTRDGAQSQIAAMQLQRKVQSLLALVAWVVRW